MAELCAVIRIMTAAPDVVCVNETFLDKGVEDVQLEGYLVVGRRDRSYSGDERRCGGIIVFARTEIAEHVSLMSMSDSSERMWILMHTHLGPYLLCCWYRPPLPGEVQSILDFEAEYNQLKDGALGMVLIGDLNLHSRRWLRHSINNSVEGEKMRALCLDYDLRQLVRGPTRDKYLLDLCISNIESVSAEVLGRIADHAIVMAKLNLAIPETRAMPRTVWSFRQADWDSLKEDLMNEDWSFFDHYGASEAAEELTLRILNAARKHIPQREIYTNKRSHPWLTDEIVELVALKRATEGTDRYEGAVRTCSENIMDEHRSYAEKSRQKLLEARRGSRQ
jgi:hypothetical protein